VKQLPSSSPEKGHAACRKRAASSAISRLAETPRGRYHRRAIADHEQYPQYVNPPEYILPHSDFGDRERWGLLIPVERGDFADIIWNECGTIIESVNAPNLRRALDEMQLKLGVESERCPHGGSINLLPGFSQMLAFTCRSCGTAVVVKGV
jgi:hypothetical protein